MSIREKVIEHVNEKGYEPEYKEELAIHFNLDRGALKEFYKVLDSMEKEGVILKLKDNRYQSVKNNKYFVEGIFSANERGFGFVSSESRDRDLHIAREFVNGAMHGDRVLCNILNEANGSMSAEGEIVNVLERANNEIVGTFEDNKTYGFVIPDNSKIQYDFFVDKKNINGAKNGQKVVLKIKKYPTESKNPEGVITEVLGFTHEKGVDILSIVRERGIPDTFSEETLRYAKSLGDVSKSDMVGRLDLTGITTFTIDGADAKDFDDAVSIEKLPNDMYRLGVHIADVSHYVREKTAIDDDAEDRGNSVYLLSKVVPMLPEELSNGLCSLKEGVVRLTMSVIMDIDKTGEVVKHEIHKSYIKSRKRLIYDDVSDFLESGETKLDYLIELKDDLFTMRELFKILKTKREKRGSIDFEFPERVIELDENDFPISIGKLNRRVANMMIEEFMLVTNETIAEEYVKKEIPFLYRVHEDPNEEKITILKRIVGNLGYVLNLKEEPEPSDLQALLEKVDGTKDAPLIKMLVLRSLKKARYAEDNLGHFGLSCMFYTHFTSPIRRYSDLMIHRIISDSLSGKLSKTKIDKLEKKLPKLAQHISMTERRAEDAEREVEDLKVAEYMKQFEGRSFIGRISSVTNFGIYVELENTAEGLVRYDEISEYMIYNEDSMSAVGEKTGKVYRPGDLVEIMVERVSIERRELDFIFPR